VRRKGYLMKFFMSPSRRANINAQRNPSVPSRPDALANKGFTGAPGQNTPGGRHAPRGLLDSSAAVQNGDRLLSASGGVRDSLGRPARTFASYSEGVEVTCPGRRPGVLSNWSPFRSPIFYNVGQMPCS
jgi:hypothetical protein